MKNILFLASVFWLISCENTDPQIIENIDPLKFQDLIHKVDRIIIDVRTPQEFYSGHIKDATNLDFYADDFSDKLKIVRKDIPVFVIGFRVFSSYQFLARPHSSTKIRTFPLQNFQNIAEKLCP